MSSNQANPTPTEWSGPLFPQLKLLPFQSGSSRRWVNTPVVQKYLHVTWLFRIPFVKVAAEINLLIKYCVWFFFFFQNLSLLFVLQLVASLNVAAKACKLLLNLWGVMNERLTVNKVNIVSGDEGASRKHSSAVFTSRWLASKDGRSDVFSLRPRKWCVVPSLFSL